MGRKRLPDPEKHCEACGALMARKMFQSTLEDMTAFRRRKFCDQACMARWMEGRIKVPGERAQYRQSRKAVADKCEICARTGTTLHVHHKDENPMNNAESNLMTLCGSCHRRAHSPNYTETGKLRKHCLLCAQPVARKGYCNTHLTRLKRHGDPLARKVMTSSGWQLLKLDS
jgi:5-methylcytosine-specific restriction endonuclease McrA